MINGRAEGVNHSLIANFRRKKVGRGAGSARKRRCAYARLLVRIPRSVRALRKDAGSDHN